MNNGPQKVPGPNLTSGKLRFSIGICSIMTMEATNKQPDLGSSKVIIIYGKGLNQVV